MSPDQWLKLIGIFVSLIGVCVWPAIVILVLISFGPSLKQFLSRTDEISLKAGASGIEVSAKRQIEAAALLGAASAQRQSQLDGGEQVGTADSAYSIAKTVGETITPSAVQQVVGARVLWVDDHPENNVYERGSLEALGIYVTISTSTEDALEKLRMTKYEVIISDMGRSGDPQAGYTLLTEKQKLGDATPFIIYAGSNLPAHKALARQKGAWGLTNNPRELFQLVISAIEKG